MNTNLNGNGANPRPAFSASIAGQMWERLRWARYAFLAGLAVGVMLGWFFHGVISLLVRFGIVLVLLLPLLVIGYFWMRSSRQSRGGNGGQQVVTWTMSGQGGPGQPPPGWPGTPYDHHPADPQKTLTDVPFSEARPPVSRDRGPAPAASQDHPDQKPTLPPDVEAELQALKRDQGRVR